MKLQSVTVKESVSFHGPADTTLLTAHGDLEFDESARCVVAKPRNGKPLIMVPLENVRCMTPVTPELEAAEARKREKPALNGLAGGVLNAAKVTEREAAAKDRKVGVVKFERGDDGKPVEKLV